MNLSIPETVTHCQKSNINHHPALSFLGFLTFHRERRTPHRDQDSSVPDPEPGSRNLVKTECEPFFSPGEQLCLPGCCPVLGVDSPVTVYWAGAAHLPSLPTACSTSISPLN